MSTLPILTVCYPWRRTPRSDGGHIDEILLGTHKDSEGARKLRMVDKINGPGGKMKPSQDTSPEHCAQREVEEEFGITPELGRIVRAGIVHVNNDGFEAEIHFFFVDQWTGEIAHETREFRDIRWHNVNDLPYADMMDADKKFALPLMLFSAMMRDEILSTHVIHDKDMIVTSCTQFAYTKRQTV